jgi:hypothetical protein
MSIDRVIELIEKQMVLTLMKNQHGTTMDEIYENSINAAKACKQIRDIFRDNGEQSPQQPTSTSEDKSMNQQFDPFRPIQRPDEQYAPAYPQVEQPRVNPQPAPPVPPVFRGDPYLDQRQDSAPENYPMPRAPISMPTLDQQVPPEDNMAAARRVHAQTSGVPSMASRPVYNPEAVRKDMMDAVTEIQEISRNIADIQGVLFDKIGGLQLRLNNLYTRVYSAVQKTY